jgi:hypothetical protein
VASFDASHARRLTETNAMPGEADRHVHAPCVPVVGHRAQRGDHVDHEQDTLRATDLAERLDVVDHSRRRLAVLGQHRDRGGLIDRRGHVLGADRRAPSVLDRPHVGAIGLRDLREALTEVPGDGHHHAISRRQEVRHRGLEPAGPRGREAQQVG